MATAGSIVVDLLMRTGSFETDSKRAERRMKQLEREVNKTVKRVALVGVAVAGTFVAAMKSANNYMAEIGNAAQRTSVSAQAFSELSYAAEQASLSQGELERVLRRSTEAINHGVVGTGKQAKALDALGISAYDATGSLKTADVMLRDLADKFSKLEPGARKTGMVLDLFGQQLGQKVIPFLNQGASGMDEMADRASELGIVIDDEAAAAAIDFEANLNDLKKAAKGLSITLMQDLLPSLNSTIRGFTEASKQGSVLIAAMAIIDRGVGKAWDSFLEIDRGPMQLFETQARLITQIEDYERALKSADGASAWLFKKGLRVAKANLSLVEADISSQDQRDNWQGKSVKELPPIEVLGDTGGGGRSKSRVKSQIDEGQRLIKQMNERIALLGKETEYEQLLAKASIDAIKFRTDADKTHALELAKTLDMRTAEIEQERTLKELREQQSITQRQFMRELDSFGQSSSVKELNSELARVEDRYRSIIDARRNSPLGLSDEELDQIRESLEEELQIVRNAHDRKMQMQQDWKLGAVFAVREYVEESENLFQSMGDLTTDVFKGMETSLTDLLMTGKASFADFANSAIREMIRMTVQAMILAPLMRSLGFSGGGFVGGIDTSYAPAHGFSDGGFTGIGGKYEPAGIVHKGEGVLSQDEIRALGGEAGFNDLRRAIRGPGHSSGGMGGRPSLPPLPVSATGSGAVNVTVNVSREGGAQVNAPAGMESMAREIGQFVEAKIREHEARSQRQGGVAWQARQGAF